MYRVTRNVRTYDHFCLLARSLEKIGDRWTLLVVRDLLTGPKRFTDLMARLGGITPKTLTLRLRELADNGMVVSDREPGRREVHYSLTSAGSELAPVVDAMTWWGLRHAWRPPQPGEPLHVEHLLTAITQAAQHVTGDREPARWWFRFPDGDYLLACDSTQWTLTATGSNGGPQPGADLTVTATVEAFIGFIFGQPGSAELDVGITGDDATIDRFHRLISAFVSTVG